MGVRLDFLAVSQDYRLGGRMYVTVSANHSEDRTTDRSVLTRGAYRKSDAHFSIVPVAQVETGRRNRKRFVAGRVLLMWGSGGRLLPAASEQSEI
jgi:hypothetical protein